MKQTLITVLFLFVVQCGWSQLEMRLKPRVFIQSEDSLTGKKIPFFMDNSGVLYSDNNTRFSHPIAAGSVYTLPQDNMPWLKPDTALVYNMPVQTAPGNGNMPNAYQPSKNELLQSLRKQFQKDKK